MTSWRNTNNLSIECPDYGKILAFWITDNNIVLCHDKNIGNFTFCRKGLTSSRSTHDQAIRVFQFLPVSHNQVVRQGIQTVVNGFSTHK